MKSVGYFWQITDQLMHRPCRGLTAEALSATVAQQLGSLSIKRLHGVVVQSSSAALSQRQINDDPPKSLEALPLSCCL